MSKLKKLGRNKIIVIALAVLLLVVVIFGSIFTLNNRNQNYVARVNGVGITKESYNTQLDQILFFYKQSSQTINEQDVKKSVLDDLINQQLIASYAKQNNITVSQSEIDAYYNQRVSAYKTEQDFLAAIKKLYNVDKQQYQVTIANDLLREAVQKKIGQPLDVWLKQQRQDAKISIYIQL